VIHYLGMGRGTNDCLGMVMHLEGEEAERLR